MKAGRQAMVNLIQRSSHLIPTGWATDALSRVRVTIFKNSVAPALTNRDGCQAGAGQGPRVPVVPELCQKLTV